MSPTTSPPCGSSMARATLRGVYHAASEDAIKDAVEDIALLQKEMDEKAYARKKAIKKPFKRHPFPSRPRRPHRARICFSGHGQP